MPEVQDTADDVNPVDFPARPATTHVSVAARHADIIPERAGIFPLAPWRMVLLLTGICLAIVCGVAAAEPIINGADLGVLISLAIFVAAFTPGRNS